MTPDELAARLERAARRVKPAVYAELRHEGELLKALIMANASGPPGPNVITGRYLGSWKVEEHEGPGGGTVTVGTEEPYGRRLEFGFVGTDSLGRTYNQRPRPHVGPAVQSFQSRFGENIKRAAGEAMHE